MLTLVAAPLLIGIDARSFVASAACLRSICVDSQPAAAPRKTIISAIGQGLRLVRTHPLLKPLAVCSATLNLFFQMLLAIFILLAARRETLRRWPDDRWRCRRERSLGAVGISLAAFAGPGTLVALILAQVIVMLGVPMYNINQVSLRHAITLAGVGMLVASAVVAFSPVRRLGPGVRPAPLDA